MAAHGPIPLNTAGIIIPFAGNIAIVFLKKLQQIFKKKVDIITAEGFIQRKREKQENRIIAKKRAARRGRERLAEAERE